MIGGESVPELLLAITITLAAIASPIGGVIALWAKPSTLFMSAVLGFTSGIFLATLAFEMLPNALEHSSLALATLGFAAGFIAVYAFDPSSIFCSEMQIHTTPLRRCKTTSRWPKRARNAIESKA